MREGGVPNEIYSMQVLPRNANEDERGKNNKTVKKERKNNKRETTSYCNRW